MMMLAAWALAVAALASDPPPIDWVVGYSNGDCEAHPHAGVQLADGGYLMIGDSQCYDESSDLKRSVFVVRTHANGTERWQTALGSIGYNYGKYAIELGDSTLLLATSMSQNSPESSPLSSQR